MRPVFDRLAYAVAGIATTLLVLIAAGVVDAGPLDPPGPPGSTSGVLRPGTPITSLPFTIDQPGSYFLTGNLTGVTGVHGLVIAADDVSLDLGGFTLQGVPNSGDGIRVQQAPQHRGVSIRNGIVRGWSASGIQAQGSIGGVFDALTAEGNGQYGIVVGNGGSLTHCAAHNNGASGINGSLAVISDCTATSNDEHGFQIGGSVLKDCVSADNGLNGVADAGGSFISSCDVEYNLAIGIAATGSRVTDNEVYGNRGNGIQIDGFGSLVANNNVHSNSQVGVGAGILVIGSASRVDENHVTDYAAAPKQETGISVTGDDNVVIRNSAQGNTLNFDLSGSGGSYGPLTTAAAATNPFSNIDY